MKRDDSSTAPLQALRDLPAGSRLVTQSTTKVQPLETAPPQEAASMKVNPTTSVATPPRAASLAPKAMHGSAPFLPPGSKFMPGRAHNPTIDGTPPHVLAAQDIASSLRQIFRGIFSVIERGADDAQTMLKWVERTPGMSEALQAQGINLEEADALVREGRALLDRFKPPVAPPVAPEETPAAS